MVAAVEGHAAGVLATDYDLRHTRVMAAYVYNSDLEVGVVVKQDISEVQAGAIVQLLILLGVAVSITLLGILVQILCARRMLRSIEVTCEAGRRAVELEKETFERLVSMMYPQFVTERLLAGELEIVLNLPEV
jgi:hypothetical protein